MQNLSQTLHFPELAFFIFWSSVSWTAGLTKDYFKCKKRANMNKVEGWRGLQWEVTEDNGVLVSSGRLEFFKECSTKCYASRERFSQFFTVNVWIAVFGLFPRLNICGYLKRYIFDVLSKVYMYILCFGTYSLCFCGNTVFLHTISSHAINKLPWFMVKGYI